MMLGGGGVTGVGWEIGLLRGLQEKDVDVTGADLLVGTSAGSVVAAQVACGVDLEAMYRRQLQQASGEIPARAGLLFALRLAWTMPTAGGDARRYRAKLGEKAVAAETVPETERMAVIGHRLAWQEWPDRKLLITAVDASDGAFVVFDRDSEASLVEAVAASCAVPLVWPPVAIGGRRFIDGGMRSGANADLASGYDRVVIVAPIERGGRISPGPRTQADRLRAEGAQVVVVAPDDGAKAAIGRNVLDPSRRGPAARAGHDQAARVVDPVAEVWQ